MTTLDQLRAQWPTLNDPLRSFIEHIVSEYIGRKWTIIQARDMVDYASHPSAIVSDGDFSVFVKTSDAVNGLDQFQTELAGLRLLTERSGVLTPAPIQTVAIEGGALMIFEAVQSVERTPDHWRDIGHTLARIHQIKGDRFGLENHAYFGPLYQDNIPADDWPTFYGERRLWPFLRLAIDSGNLPLEVAHQVETIIARLSKLCGPAILPTLLHGDAQQNNFISASNDTYAIDPAVYFGHPELDLALVDYFQPVPDAVFEGYRELLPIDPGFAERRDLWRIAAYLAVVTVGGAQYVGWLTAAMRNYL